MMHHCVALPSWLETPPSSQVAPPVVTRDQLLPLGSLNWKDFERLCLQIVRTESDVESCQLYGDQGDEQLGIDLYARLNSGGYSVYQCKEVAEFGPAQISAAVRLFLAGTWSKKASKFVLCMSERATLAQRAARIEELRTELAQRKIVFEVWDVEELSRRLKSLPVVVDDFFGREWVKRFCGEQHAAELGRRLDAGNVHLYRRELSAFYTHLFTKNDPGLPLPSHAGADPLPLQRRYVLPDIIRSDPAGLMPVLSFPGRGEVVQAELSELWRGGEVPARSAKGRTSGTVATSNPEPVDGWLSASARSVVLGGPGSGKSSLLRFLALDLLADAPEVEAWARRWGHHLPVWISFAYWTRLLNGASTQPVSLVNCLENWFRQWEAPELWPLVEQAIHDERLLLLVDGLDEWTSETVGATASQMLQIFLERRNVDAVVTSRPHGYERVGMQGADWQIGNLAPLSDAQQARLAELWFEEKLKRETPASTSEDELRRRTRLETEPFLLELKSSSDLGRLAQTPLLLSLLIYLRFQHVTLPSSRFRAYEEIIEQFLREHPARRSVASLGAESTSALDVREIRQALGSLAFALQCAHPDGIVEDDTARRVIEEYLASQDGLGLPIYEARRLSARFLSIAEGAIGILVRQGRDKLSFFHRGFQEYLAAWHLHRSDWTEQLHMVGERAGDATWHEVILGTVALTNRPREVEQIISTLRQARTTAPTLLGMLDVTELLAEIAFGSFDSPPTVARELASEACASIRSSTWLPHRQRLLKHIVDGTRSTKTRAVAESHLRRWVWSTARWREQWYLAMDKWPADQPTFDLLLDVLHDEEPQNQRAAARVLAKLASGREDVASRLALLAVRGEDPFLQAAAVEALAVGWPRFPGLDQVVDHARQSECAELRVAAIAAKATLGSQEDQDLDVLLSFLRVGPFPGIDRQWKAAAVDAILNGWPRSGIVKTQCLRAVRRQNQLDPDSIDDIERDDAWQVLLRGFPQDPDVARTIAAALKETYPSFSLLNISGWYWLAQNFRENPTVVSAIDDWVSQPGNSDMYLAQASLVGRTPTVKAKLLASLSESFPHWPATALLEGWGIKDIEVASALVPMANGPAESSSQIAYLIPRIVVDRSAARERLIEILNDPQCVRPDFVVTGLATVSTDDDRNALGERIISALDVRTRVWSRFDLHNPVPSLIAYFPKHPFVRELALRQLEEHDPPISLLAGAYADDPELRQGITERGAPLPSTLRAYIASSFGALTPEPFVLDLLSRFDDEEDEQVKTLASISYHKLLLRSGLGVGQEVDRLKELIGSAGPDHESRRQAALAGLIILRRGDVLREHALRPKGQGGLDVGLGMTFNPNLTLIRLLLDRWPDVVAMFGDDLAPRLSGYLESTDSFWRKISLAASDYPACHQAILDALDATPDLLHDSDILTCLSVIWTEPNSADSGQSQLHRSEYTESR